MKKYIIIPEDFDTSEVYSTIMITPDYIGVKLEVDYEEENSTNDLYYNIATDTGNFWVLADKVNLITPDEYPEYFL